MSFQKARDFKVLTNLTHSSPLPPIWENLGAATQPLLLGELGAELALEGGDDGGEQVGGLGQR